MNDNFLDYKLHNKVNLVPASISKRLINLIVDVIAIVILYVVISFFLRLVIGIFFFSWITVLIFFLLYFGISELVMDGKTFGKIITRTRVVTLQGYKPDISAIFIRMIARLLPIDGLFLFTKENKTLHDQFSKTIVVDESLSQL